MHCKTVITISKIVYTTSSKVAWLIQYAEIIQQAHSDFDIGVDVDDLQLWSVEKNRERQR
jgi:hypothetical protein